MFYDNDKAISKVSKGSIRELSSAARAKADMTTHFGNLTSDRRKRPAHFRERDDGAKAIWVKREWKYFCKWAGLESNHRTEPFMTRLVAPRSLTGT
jgi:hypothetical protein